jgi:hypothetical protein
MPRKYRPLPASAHCAPGKDGSTSISTTRAAAASELPKKIGKNTDLRMIRLIDCMASIPAGASIASNDRITNAEKVK